MKEITKTITKEYNEQGQLIREIETTLEKEYEDKVNTYPYYPTIYNTTSSI